MPRYADEELEKVTLNLYKRDVAFFRKTYGQGYTEMIRLMLREKADELRNRES